MANEVLAKGTGNLSASWTRAVTNKGERGFGQASGRVKAEDPRTLARSCSLSLARARALSLSLGGGGERV